MKRLCVVCGHEFAVTARNGLEQRFCSAKCRAREHRRRRGDQAMSDFFYEFGFEWRVCAGCGQDFPAYGVTARFCSPLCGKRHRDRKRSEAAA